MKRRAAADERIDRCVTSGRRVRLRSGLGRRVNGGRGRRNARLAGSARCVTIAARGRTDRRAKTALCRVGKIRVRIAPRETIGRRARGAPYVRTARSGAAVRRPRSARSVKVGRCVKIGLRLKVAVRATVARCETPGRRMRDVRPVSRASNAASASKAGSGRLPVPRPVMSGRRAPGMTRSAPAAPVRMPVAAASPGGPRAHRTQADAQLRAPR